MGMIRVLKMNQMNAQWIFTFEYGACMKDCLNALEKIFIKDLSRPFLLGNSKAQGIGDDDEVSLLEKTIVRPIFYLPGPRR